MPSFAAADDRGVIAVKGPDAQSFLQGLVTADVAGQPEDRARWSAFLTPQGKYLHDFFALRFGDAVLLECEKARADDLIRRLSPFRLRAKVEIANWSTDWRVAQIWGEGAAAAAGLGVERGAAAAFAGGLAYVDPRLIPLGVRVAAPRDAIAASLKASGAEPGDRAQWDKLRVALGVPDGARDLVVGKSVLLEFGFDELGGIDWQKGCFMGQELTARTRYRGLVKKRLAPFRIAGETPPAGSALTFQNEEAGEMRSVAGQLGLALAKRTAIAAACDESVDNPPPLRWHDTRLTPELPEWMEFLMESAA